MYTICVSFTFIIFAYCAYVKQKNTQIERAFFMNTLQMCNLKQKYIDLITQLEYYIVIKMKVG